MGEEGALLLPGGVSALWAEASLGAVEGREREATLGRRRGPSTPPLIAPPHLDEETLPDFKRPGGQMVEEVALQ